MDDDDEDDDGRSKVKLRACVHFRGSQHEKRGHTEK